MHLNSRQRGEWFLMIPHIWILSWVDFPWINFLSSLLFWWTDQHWQIHKLSSCPRLLFSFFKKFVYLKGRQTDRHRRLFYMLVYSSYAQSSWSWVRQVRIQSALARTQLLELSPLPHGVNINRKLNSKAELGGEPRGSSMGHKWLKWHLNCYSKDPFLFHFSRIQNSK